MKTYQIVIDGTSYFFKTNASVEVIEQAIRFVENAEVTLDKVLVAIRMLGSKATPVTIEPADTFHATSAFKEVAGTVEEVEEEDAE